MEPEGSLPHSQVPAICLYPETGQSSPYPKSHSLKIHINIILPYTPGSPQGLFPSSFPNKTLYTLLPSPSRAICPAQLIFPDFITHTILGEDYRSWSSSLWSFLHSPITPSLLDPNILFNTLFSNTLSLHSSINVSDEVSYPDKTTGKISSVSLNLYIFG
jgi:hypothetical protein